MALDPPGEFGDAGGVVAPAGDHLRRRVDDRLLAVHHMIVQILDLDWAKGVDRNMKGDFRRVDPFDPKSVENLWREMQPGGGRGYGAVPGRWTFLTGPKKEIFDLTRNGYHLGLDTEGEEAVIHCQKFVLVDRRADIWSIGVVLYELISGRRPFDGANAMAIISAIATR